MYKFWMASLLIVISSIVLAVFPVQAASPNPTWKSYTNPEYSVATKIFNVGDTVYMRGENHTANTEYVVWFSYSHVGISSTTLSDVKGIITARIIIPPGSAGHWTTAIWPVLPIDKMIKTKFLVKDQ